MVVLSLKREQSSSLSEERAGSPLLWPLPQSVRSLNSLRGRQFHLLALKNFARNGVTLLWDSEGEAVATNVSDWVEARPAAIIAGEPEEWFALHTKSRHEKAVARRLTELGIPSYLPLVNEVRRWSDRNKHVEVPVFSCYVFAKLTMRRWDRLRIVGVDGVLSVVGSRGAGTAIPEEQIGAIRTLVDLSLPWTSHPFLRVGQQVRIRGGALEGIEGILVSRSGNHTLVVSIDALQRSLAVQVDGYKIEPI